ncbi:hypothetical protein R3P38DRAFT_2551384, partial [Favolaschia claudopus]
IATQAHPRNEDRVVAAQHLVRPIPMSPGGADIPEEEDSGEALNASTTCEFRFALGTLCDV